MAVIALNTKCSEDSLAIIEPTTIVIEPIQTSVDISDQVTSVIENANSVRLKVINDLILQLEKDFIK